MILKIRNLRKHYLAFVIVFSLLITVSLSIATYYINYWPTDSENPYIPTAARLFELPFLSQMHHIPQTAMLRVNMRAKETLIVGIAIMQRIFNDYESLFPNVFLLILSVGISAILCYLILRNFFDEDIGFAGFLLFISSFWPYMYILQGAHPPLVLLNFLFAVFFLQISKKRNLFYFLSGIFLGLMLFSSPTSPLYLPYYLGIFLYLETADLRRGKNFREFISRGLAVILGLSVILLLYTIPHPWLSIKQYIQFLQFSRRGNNFVIYRDYLSQFFPVPESLRGAGWIWIFKYILLIMPWMFLMYLISVLLLLKYSLKKPLLVAAIILSFSTPVGVEWIKVAQLGRNYFSWLIGIIFLICCALYSFKNENLNLTKQRKYIFAGLFLFLWLGHAVFNMRIFFSDIFPSRMTTTDIYRWLTNKRVNELYAYNNHPRNMNMVWYFNNTNYANKVYFWGINTIRDADHGYILVPPITGKTIYCECRQGDFTGDPYLTELYNSGEFYKYVAASFKTLSSSKIWVQEEEICTYRDLIIRDITDTDRKKGLAWILDASKLQKDWFSHHTKDLR